MRGRHVHPHPALDKARRFQRKQGFADAGGMARRERGCGARNPRNPKLGLLRDPDCGQRAVGRACARSAPAGSFSGSFPSGPSGDSAQAAPAIPARCPRDPRPLASPGRRGPACPRRSPQVVVKRAHRKGLLETEKLYEIKTSSGEPGCSRIPGATRPKDSPKL